LTGVNDETEAVPEDQAKRDGAPESALGGGEDVIEAITFKGGDGERLGSLSNGEGDEVCRNRWSIGLRFR